MKKLSIILFSLASILFLASICLFIFRGGKEFILLEIKKVEVEDSLTTVFFKAQNLSLNSDEGFKYGQKADLSDAKEILIYKVKKDLYKVTFKDLLPNTKYYYRGSKGYLSRGKLTDIESFTTSKVDLAVSTLKVMDITFNSKNIFGQVMSDGGFPVISRGICWSITPEPTILDNKTIEGVGTGSFNSILEDLDADTKYFARAYATNLLGASYGNELVFTTSKYRPLVFTQKILNVSATTATILGLVMSRGAAITTRGVCWSDSEEPTIKLPTKIVNGEGIGSFTSTIEGLKPNSEYKVRTYAESAEGISYGYVVIIKTSGSGTTTTSSSSSSLSKVSTFEILGLESDSVAIGGGSVVTDGGFEVIARGLCWNTSGNPTIHDHKSESGTGLGDFDGRITGIQPDTAYYVRAYATTSAGTSYGELKTFIIGESLVVFTSDVIELISETVAKGKGSVVSDGGSEVIARGLCWNTTGSPTVLNNKSENGNGLGDFEGNITNVEPGLLYYVRAYATTSAGTSYGEEKVFGIQ